MERKFDFVVQVIYNGSIQVMAKNLAEAEARVRQLVRPQGVFNGNLMAGEESYNCDTHPEVHFLHHSEWPNTEEQIKEVERFKREHQ